MTKREPHWFVLALVFSLGWAVVYFDRMMFTPIMDTLVDTYHLSAQAIGVVFSVFFLGYTLLQIPGGLLGDRFGYDKIIRLTFIGMAVVSLVSGFTTSFLLFMMLRFVVGAFEGLYYGPQFALSSAYVPREHKVFATTVINSGMSVGIIAGTTLPLWLTHLGFNLPALYGVVVLLSLVVLGLLSKTMPTLPRVTHQARFKLTPELAKVFFVSFCSLYAFFNLLTWLQHYLVKEKGMEVAMVATAMLLISVVSIVSALVFSRLVDRFKAIRGFTMALVVLTLLSLAGIVMCESPWLILVMVMAYGAFGKMALDPILIIAVAERTPREASLGTTLAVFNFVGLVSAVIAPFVGGQWLKWTGTLTGSFGVSMGLLGVAFLVAMTFKTPAQS